MTTSQSLKLKRKSGKQIDLSSAPYAIGELTIPALAEQAQFASGSSANVYGGGIRASVKYSNRNWTFTIRILSTTDAAIRNYADRVSDFLMNLDPNDPTYIEYRANTDTPEPLWGNYGTTLRFEVVGATVLLNQDYADYNRRGLISYLTISTSIKPLAETKTQLVCAATGGINEDTIGVVDGSSKGTLIPEATTNKMTNPVFSYSTWSNNWVIAANVVATQSTDENFLLPGTVNSARLTCKAATLRTFAQLINAGNTNTHTISFYAKRPDGAAVSSADVGVWYNAEYSDGTYQSVGNGWYRVTKTTAGINSSVGCGVAMKNGQTVYVTGFQLEEKAYATPLCFGDMLGCAWTGTAHDSTSTRTAASCKIPISTSNISAAGGSLRLVIRFDVPNTHPNIMALADLRDGSNTNAIAINFTAADDKFNFIAGGATLAATAAKTFAAGTTYVFHFVWDAATGAATIYVNGAADGTSSSYVYASLGANLFIGSDYSSANQIDGAVSYFDTLDRALTSTQVLNDYTNLAPLVADGRRPGTIPWFYTDDGDNILSLDTGKQPLGIVAGIPGSAPAVTEIRGDSSGLTTIKGILLSCFDTSVPLKFADLFTDSSGTVLAGDYGGQHKNTTITSPASVISTGFTPRAIAAKELNGKEAYVVSRIKAASATAFYIKTALVLSGASVSYSDNRLITPATTYRMFRTNKIVLNTYNIQYGDLPPYLLTCGGVSGEAVTGSLSVDGDWASLAPRNMIVIATSGAGGGSTKFSYQGMKAYDIGYAANDWLGSQLPCSGDPIEFIPARYNNLQCYVGAEESVDPLTTYTVTMTSIKITPRWALL